MLIPSASASKLKTNKTCEFQYFLQYHLMVPQLRGENIYSAKGTAVHDALEKWVNAVNGDTENGAIDWMDTLKKYYAKSRLWTMDDRKPPKGYPHPVQKNCETCQWATKDGMCSIANEPTSVVDGCPAPNFEDDVKLVEKTLSRTDYNPLKRRKDGMFARKILGVEQEFNMTLGGVKVKGFMDLVTEEDSDTLEVCDYKTGASMSYEKACVDPQVRIYGAVARILWPQYKYVMVTLHYLKKNPVSVSLSAEDDVATIKSLVNNYNEISTNKNPQRNKNFLCENFCVGYENCGTVQKSFSVAGKFRLPIISCGRVNKNEPCWGSIYPEKTGVLAYTDFGKIKYTCSGHAKVQDGGEYEKEGSPNGDKVAGQDSPVC